eukprot:Cvel_5345.t1-p1 / transcript=Cvel_5345.t1 / gene=Cvel_5345 / organism=Chromera_velia_CCMP2878 / gene_product=hypothetical protein / transcript_product=hypothetical protein / location=Cvel_scaffold248:1198-3742(-) / protein_length=377 / sequence_SO=supercontig / SO=protein_coding / is_pseudo=false
MRNEILALLTLMKDLLSRWWAQTPPPGLPPSGDLRDLPGYPSDAQLRSLSLKSANSPQKAGGGRGAGSSRGRRSPSPVGHSYRGVAEEEDSRSHSQSPQQRGFAVEWALQKGDAASPYHFSKDERGDRERLSPSPSVPPSASRTPSVSPRLAGSGAASPSSARTAKVPPGTFLHKVLRELVRLQRHLLLAVAAEASRESLERRLETARRSSGFTLNAELRAQLDAYRGELIRLAALVEKYEREKTQAEAGEEQQKLEHFRENMKEELEAVHKQMETLASQVDVAVAESARLEGKVREEEEKRKAAETLLAVAEHERRGMEVRASKAEEQMRTMSLQVSAAEESLQASLLRSKGDVGALEARTSEAERMAQMNRREIQ